MSMYRKEWACCGSVTETDAWEPDSCPFCTPARAEQPFVLSDTLRDKVRDAIADALGDAYDCTRVWSAWSYGTMGPDDFSLIWENEERLMEITDAALNAILAAKEQA
jgi:hypothetical protein